MNKYVIQFKSGDPITVLAANPREALSFVDDDLMDQVVEVALYEGSNLAEAMAVLYENLQHNTNVVFVAEEE